MTRLLPRVSVLAHVERGVYQCIEERRRILYRLNRHYAVYRVFNIRGAGFYDGRGCSNSEDYNRVVRLHHLLEETYGSLLLEFELRMDASRNVEEQRDFQREFSRVRPVQPAPEVVHLLQVRSRQA